MHNKYAKLRLKVVKHYLGNADSMRKTALKFHISYLTVFKWVKIYQNQGEAGFLSTYKRPWNRATKELEEKVSLLKEHNPSITIRKAKEILEKENVKISTKGIWGIWKRYGYAGFNKENLSNEFLDYCSWSKEATKKFVRAKELFNRGAIERSAEILNSIPFLPENELLLQIPDSLLNIRRRVEKMTSLFWKIPISTYLEKVRELYQECKEANLYYSALRIGIAEVKALSWYGKPMKQLKKTEELKKILKRTGNHFSYSLLALQFSLLISEGITCAHLLKIERASEIAKLCRKILRRQKYSPLDFMFNLGILNTHLYNFIEAEYWYSRSLEKAGGKLNKLIKIYLANILFHKGEYREAIGTLKNAELPVWGRSRKLFYQSMQSLINGMPHRAISLSIRTLSILKKEDIHARIFRAYFTMAGSYCSLGEKTKAKNILKRLVPFLVKNELRKQTTILNTLFSQSPNPQTQNLLSEDIFPSVKLALMLKNGNYWRAFKYADKKGMVADFHRYVFFFPEAVIRIIEKGKSTGLPKRMLRLPVFNKEVRVYYPKILGDLIIYKNQRYLRVKLQPKDTAFLIHLAFRAGELGKEISLESLYNNFWKKSKHPARNLSHLLVRLKKNLKIPSHLLEVSYKKDKPVLTNKGIHFITDYGEYQESIAQAKALLRADEWGFAKREYLHAIKLFRGEPFKKMYDDWSDDKRLEILFGYETEILSFAKELKKRGRKEEAEKLLKRAERIVPNLDFRPET